MMLVAKEANKARTWCLTNCCCLCDRQLNVLLLAQHLGLNVSCDESGLRVCQNKMGEESFTIIVRSFPLEYRSVDIKRAYAHVTRRLLCMADAEEPVAPIRRISYFEVAGPIRSIQTIAVLPAINDFPRPFTSII